MKFTCLQENLLDGLHLVSHLAAKNASLPVLNNVLVTAEGSKLELATTNLEIAMIAHVRGKIEAPGRVAIPARALTEFVALLAGERIDVTQVDQGVTVTSKRATSTIKGVSADEFPVIPTAQRTNAVTMTASDLRHSLSQVAFAQAHDEARPEINGVYLSVESGVAKLAATDSYRLAESTLPVSAKATGSAIVPARTVGELLRVLPESNEQVELYLSENQLLISLPGLDIISRIVEGQYPAYQEIIPGQFKTTVTSSRDEFARAVKGAALFSKSGINDVALTVAPESGISVAAANATLGEAVSSAGARVTGEQNSIVFNHRYLLDGLAAAGSDEVTLELIDGANPGLIKAVGSDRFRYLVMPIKQ